MKLAGRVRVDRVRSGSAAAEFVDVPWRLLGSARQWAPPGLRSAGLRELDRRAHPFYAESYAAFFVAREGGEVVGRIAALHDVRHTRHRNEPAGFFGYFDAVDDDTVAGSLLEAAAEWLAARGLTSMTGPRSVSGFEGAVLVEGFEHDAVLGAGWNPPFYDGLLRKARLEPAQEYVSGWFPPDHVLDLRIEAIADRARRRDLWVRSFRNREEVSRWATRIVPVFTAAMSGLATFVPPSDAQVEDVVRTLGRIADPRAVKLLMRELQPVGFLVAYPDLAPALRAVDGRLLPLGWARLAAARKRRGGYVINGLGVVPELRGTGGNALLYREIARTLRDDIGITRAEVALVAAENARSLRDMDALGVHWYKRHRHYRREL